MVKPVDFQDNLSKAPLASRLQHNQNEAHENAQRLAAQAAEREQKLDQSRTQPTKESDQVELHPDEKEDRRERKKRESSRAEDETPEAADDSEFSGIDIVA